MEYCSKCGFVKEQCECENSKERINKKELKRLVKRLLFEISWTAITIICWEIGKFLFAN